MELNKWLSEKIAQVAGIDIQQVDHTKPLREMGVYAKAMERVLLELGTLLGRELPSTLAFSYPTIDTLVAFLLQQAPGRDTKIAEQKNAVPIAVVGMDCRFPGGCDSPEKLWEALKASKNLVSEVPAKRWDAEALFDADATAPGKMITKHGGFVGDIDLFDAGHFGITPREAQSMDVQQRLALEVAWRALESAGECGPALSGSSTGVFMGAGGCDYTRRYFEDFSRLDFYASTGSYSSIVSNRISYVLGLQGPSISIDTACSSALVSIHMACQSLTAHECNMAIAGGVNAIVSPEMSICFSKAKMLSPDGKCKAFDASANGFVRAEGCGVVILKRLDDAIRDKNHFLCVLRGSGVNHVGRSNGISAPSSAAQGQVIRQALKNAGVRPCDVQYIEAHGTGTAVGDPVEMDGIRSAMAEGRDASNPLVVGTVKTNIGHLEIAAGVAGLIKVILCMQHGQIPPHLHFQELNPRISLADIPAVLPLETMDWKRKSGQPRLAGVSSFGFGGVNAHVVVEDYCPAGETQACDEPAVFMLSAKSASALAQMEERFVKHFRNGEVPYINTCYTANVGRARFAHRMAIVAQSNREASAILKQDVQSRTPEVYYRGVRKPVEERKLAFLFTGQGSQYPDMGRQLYEREPVFHNALLQCDAIAKEYMDRSIVDLLYHEQQPQLLQQTQYTQPVLFAFEYALAMLWRSWGVEPSVVAGHSVGEYTAACIAGVFSLEDALKMICARGSHIQSLPQNGAMLAVNMPLEQAQVIIGKQEALTVSIAAVNSPVNTVISGPVEQIARIEKAIQDAGGTCSRLRVSHAFHSTLLQPAVDAYRQVVETVSFHAPKIPLVSNVTGAYVDAEALCNAEYWCAHMLKPVYFANSIDTMYESGVSFYLEVGPHPVLTGFVKQILRGKPATCIASQRRDEQDASIKQCIASLFVSGWDFPTPLYDGRKIPLPTYPFQRKSYWYPASNTQLPLQEFNPFQPQLISSPFHKSAYEFRCGWDSPYLQDHKVNGKPMFPGIVMVAMIHTCTAFQYGNNAFCLKDLRIQQHLVLEKGEEAVLQVYISQSGEELQYDLYSQVYSPGRKREDIEWTKHLSGYAEPSRDRSVKPEVIDIQTSQGNVQSGAAFYAGLQRAGLEFGPSFQVVKKTCVDSNGVKAWFEPSKNRQATGFAPNIMDACAQMLLLDKRVPQSSYVFAGFDCLSIQKAPVGETYCTASVAYLSDDGRTLTGDYHLVEAEGAVAAYAQGIHLVQAEPVAGPATVPIDADDSPSALRYDWEIVHRQSEPHPITKRWVVFADQDEAAEWFGTSLEAQGDTCFYVYAGESFKKDNNIYYIRPECQADYHALFDDIGQPIACIVNFWPITMGTMDWASGPSLLTQRHGYGAGLFLAQTALEHASIAGSPIWMITQNSQAVDGSEIPNGMEQASVWGLSRVLLKEIPEQLGGIVDIAVPNDRTAQILQDIIHGGYAGTPFFAIRDSQVYCQRLVKNSLPVVSVGTTPIRGNGCYVITGGAGGLGVVLAQWLADQGAGYIALISRGAQQADLSELHSSLPAGVKCRPYNCDIANEEQLRNVIDEIHRELAPVAGAFHLAGAIQDAPIYQQTWEQYANVYQPKVQGAWALCQALQHKPVDFVVLYSSIASMVGTAGQANYAAANAVMDSLACFYGNAGQRILSVNWGLWDAGGMRDQMGEKALRRLLEQGIGLMQSEDALQALSVFLGMDNVQQGFANFVVERYAEAAPNKAKRYFVQEQAQSGPRTAGGRTIAEKKPSDIILRIQRLVGQAVWIQDYADIDIDANLLDLGLDSLVVLNLRTSLKNEFGLEVPYKEFLNCRTIRTLAALLGDVQTSAADTGENEFGARQALAMPSPHKIEITAAPDSSDFDQTVRAIQMHVGQAVMIEEYEGIDIDENLLDLGLDSLIIVSLRATLKKEFDIEIPFKEFLNCRTIRKLANLIIAMRSPDPDPDPNEEKQTSPKAQEAASDFALTDVQHAYWVGRGNQFALGGVSCHLYVEVNVKDVDISRLNSAVNRLIERHEMLRAVFSEQGRQRVLPNYPPYEIVLTDCRAMDDEERTRQLRVSREELSHAVHNSVSGPLYAIRAFQLDQQWMQLHISLDMLVADGYSFNILLKDLYAYYMDGGQALPTLSYTFLDYIQQDAQTKQSAEYQQALAYWEYKVQRLPSAPPLPLACDPQSIANPIFIRKKETLPQEVWGVLKKLAAGNGLTASGLLLGAFAYIVRKWCGQDEFSLMMTLFNRKPFHPQVNEIVGDFTSLIALGVQINPKHSFLDNARNIQAAFWEDMENSAVSGVEVLRMKAKHSGQVHDTIPVVFTSVLPYSTQSGGGGSTIDVPAEFEPKLVYGISQTPQVWIDFQIFENDGALTYNWDTVEEVFIPEMLDDMFTAYHQLLADLADGGGVWQAADPVCIPERQSKQRLEINHAQQAVPEMLLHELFFKHAAAAPERAALLQEQRTVTYGELADQGRGVGELLVQAGARKSDIVAILLPKGPEQVSAVLGVMVAGCAYLPLDIALPGGRIEEILLASGAKFLLTRKDCGHETKTPCVSVFMEQRLELPATGPVALQPQPDDLAYVIYTSGSTGKPKGVMISHCSAVNTILDVNRRFNVGDQDRVLALSHLNFDLSVYDIFGMLCAGGSIVFPTEETQKDPAAWESLVDKHKITVWNTVPALMEMYATYLNGKGRALPTSLRLLLLSGDWIPLGLADTLLQELPEAQIISLGGATEASIWSILYPIRKIDPQWTSIPYGFPMDNQAFYILNESMADCPDYVPGELYIGGVGVAMGYLNDPERTGDCFVKHPYTGESLYRTGDYGRYLPDGCIEFLGRRDQQVKIGGHRIELGEIEAVLSRHPQVQDSAAVIAQGNADQQIIGYFTPKRQDFSKAQTDAFACVLEEICAQTTNLPSEEELDLVQAYNLGMDKFAAEIILDVLQKSQIFQAPDTWHRPEEIQQRMAVVGEYERLLQMWLDFLTEEGILAVDAATGYRLLREPVRAPYGKEEQAGAELRQSIRHLTAKIPEVICGQKEPFELFYGNGPLEHTPESLAAQLPGAQRVQALFLDCIESLVKRKTSIRILEVGARTGTFAQAALELLHDRGCMVDYTVSDASPFFIGKAQERLETFENVSFELLNLENDDLPLVDGDEQYDLVIAANALHRCSNLPFALSCLHRFLHSNGLLLVMENTFDSKLQLLTAAVAEAGFSGLVDKRSGSNTSLLPHGEWVMLLEEAGYAAGALPGYHAQLALLGATILVAQSVLDKPAVKDVLHFAGQYLPDYMVPSKVVALGYMPLNTNGKVARSMLQKYGAQAPQEQENEQRPAENETESALCSIWRDLLRLDAISMRASFFELGGDSLLGTVMIGKIRDRFGTEVSLRDIFQNPTVERLAVHIQAMTSTNDARNYLPVVCPDPNRRYAPFPLTEVQQAYWLGRTGAFELGKVSTHSYFEIERRQLDVRKLEDSWNRLIQRHDMMRVTISGQTQSVMNAVEPYQIQVLDLREQPADAASEALLSIREELSHQVLSIHKWPPFEIRAVIYGEDMVRLLVSFDNLIFDGSSMLFLFDEWARIYDDPDMELPQLALTFRDYVNTKLELENTAQYQKDREYWLERAATLPAAPGLPVRNAGDGEGSNRFSRLDMTLPRYQWDQVKGKAQELSVTPSALLLTAFSYVLGRYSKSQHFTINLTLFNRLELHPQVMDIIGDFTSLTLLEIDTGTDMTFAQCAKQIQEQLWSDLSHATFGGVSAIREYTRANGMTPGSAVMPVVFTSALGLSDGGSDGSGITRMGELVYNITQTPQVWLDHQVYENNGSLVLNWDYVAQLFPAGFIDTVFAEYCSLLEKLASSSRLWETRIEVPLPARQQQERKALESRSDTSQRLLHELFAEQAICKPENIAIIASGKTLRYRDVFSAAWSLSEWLLQENVTPNTLVAVVMQKGWEQVVGVMAILFAGAAYLPIDPSTPEERLHYLLANGEVRVALTQPDLVDSLTWPDTVRVMAVRDSRDDTAPATVPGPRQEADDLAYVIFTSGSTGTPKGVMIDHKGVVNTILEVNQQLQLQESDRTIALSNLNFDLSVYDIFGPLACGGAIVMPDAVRERDPAHWLELLAQHEVSIWNTVPALMQALTERGQPLPKALRAILLSGDFIPLQLPDSIRRLSVGDPAIFSLGGATEASIWSIYYPIHEVEASWSSIPYGYPLHNQTVQVLNARMEMTPDYVPGEIYIGGIGLAKGYWKDDAKTQSSFSTHPGSGERLYRTGDIGRYLPGGTIEIIGREDSQVKIRGYRIELGEVSAAIESCAGVRQAVVSVTGEKQHQDLAAFVVGDGTEPFGEEVLRESLHCKLPRYMIPQHIQIIDEIPLTPNGKIDSKKLVIDMQPNANAAGHRQPMTAPEQIIASMLCEILNLEYIGPEENFFDLGADSLHIMRLQGQIEKQLGRQVDIVSLFEHTSVRQLNAYLSDGQKQAYGSGQTQRGRNRRGRRQHGLPTQGGEL